MGGGGFGTEPRNPRLDLYILSQSKNPRPKICFVPTASGDSLDYVRRFHEAFKKHACEPSDLCLFRRDARDPAKHLLDQEIIYVGGGSTFNLLALWRLHRIDKTMRTAWQRGTILCGVSAGMICWFDCCITDSFGPLATLDDGLGLLPGSACPHFNGEANRRPVYHEAVRKGFPAGLAADDGAAIHFVGRKIFRCVSSRPASHAYRIARVKGKVVEETLATTFLDSQGRIFSTNDD